MIWHRLISILLAPILLWASMGFSISRHYCLGMLIEEEFYQSIPSCEEDKCCGDSKSTDSSCYSDIGCCKDVWIQVDQVKTLTLIEVQDNLRIPIEEELPFTSAIPSTPPTPKKDILSPPSSGPPDHQPLHGNYLVELQRFLI